MKSVIKDVTNKSTEIIRVMSKKNKSLPKSLMAYLMAMQFCYGYDMGFDKDITGRKTRILIKIIKFTVIFLMIFLTVSPLSYEALWYWGAVFKYSIFIVILHLSNYKPYDFLCEVYSFGEGVSSIQNILFGILIMVYTFGMSLFKWGLVNFRCINLRNRYCYDISNLHRVFQSYCLQGVDSIDSIQIVFAFHLYCLVYNMRHSLVFENDLKKFEQRFVNIASFCDKIRKLYESIVLTEVFISVPRIMQTLWYMLFYIKENAKWYSYIIESVFALHLMLWNFIPAVLAEMVNRQMDSINLYLNEQRRLEKDKEKSEEMTRILRYIKARRLQNDIWGVIPIDLRLPLGLISLCTTYFIVILQFTHLYD